MTSWIDKRTSSKTVIEDDALAEIESRAIAEGVPAEDARRVVQAILSEVMLSQRDGWIEWRRTTPDDL